MATVPPDHGDGFCDSLVYNHPILQVGLFSFVFAVIQIAGTCLVLFWLWRQRLSAERGEESSAKSLVLPLYSWILWIFAIASVLQAIVNVAVPMTPGSKQSDGQDVVYRYCLVARCRNV